jgi:hypothetical protein
MADRRHALIVASSRYDDPDLQRLIAPGADAAALADVLGDPAIGGFEVKSVHNKPMATILEEIDGFFEGGRRDDLLLFYFSGHGIKGNDGKLYFAARNTDRRRLRSTAVPARLVYEMMDQSRSKRQLLILDCCYSGAFTRELVPKDDTIVHANEELAGYGRAILTASDAMQYAFQGDAIEEIGGSKPLSVFTSTLVRGLKSGEADLDRDGRITLDELYRFVERGLHDEEAPQTPQLTAVDVRGDLVVARNPRPLPIVLAVEGGGEAGPAGTEPPRRGAFAHWRLVAAGLALAGLGAGAAVTFLPSTAPSAGLSPKNATTAAAWTLPGVPAKFPAPAKSSGCRVHGGLPDAACTPGAVMSTNVRAICSPGYTSSVRNVPQSLRLMVFRRYGLARHPAQSYEVDHLVSLAFGGSNSIGNLWIEPAGTLGYHQKDAVENFVHDQICRGNVALADAQRSIANDWVKIWKSLPPAYQR